MNKLTLLLILLGYLSISSKCSGQIDKWDFIPDATFGVDTLVMATPQDEKIISVYPNPTSYQMRLQSNFPSEVKIVRIYDLRGQLKVTLERVPCGDSYDLKNVIGGTYLIVAEFSNGQTSSTRMIYTP